MSLMKVLLVSPIACTAYLLKYPNLELPSLKSLASFANMHICHQGFGNATLRSTRIQGRKSAAI